MYSEFKPPRFSASNSGLTLLEQLAILCGIAGFLISSRLTEFIISLTGAANRSDRAGGCSTAAQVICISVGRDRRAGRRRP